MSKVSKKSFLKMWKMHQRNHKCMYVFFYTTLKENLEFLERIFSLRLKGNMYHAK